MRKFLWKPFKGAIVKVYCNNDDSVKYGKVLGVFKNIVNKESREVAYLKAIDYIPKLWSTNFFLSENKIKFIR